jgi:hypothetical protein
MTQPDLLHLVLTPAGRECEERRDAEPGAGSAAFALSEQRSEGFDPLGVRLRRNNLNRT